MQLGMMAFRAKMAVRVEKNVSQGQSAACSDDGKRPGAPAALRLHRQKAQ